MIQPEFGPKMYLCSCSCPNAQHICRAPPPWQVPPGKPEAQDERSRAELRCWSPHFSRRCVAGETGGEGRGRGRRGSARAPAALHACPPGLRDVTRHREHRAAPAAQLPRRNAALLPKDGRLRLHTPPIKTHPGVIRPLKPPSAASRPPCGGGSWCPCA